MKTECSLLPLCQCTNTVAIFPLLVLVSVSFRSCLALSCNCLILPFNFSRCFLLLVLFSLCFCLVLSFCFSHSILILAWFVAYTCVFFLLALFFPLYLLFINLYFIRKKILLFERSYFRLQANSWARKENKSLDRITNT